MTETLDDLQVVRWRFEDYWAGTARSTNYFYTGGPQTFHVPDGITRVRVALRGPHGSGTLSEGVYLGGLVIGYLDVEPNEDLGVYVGGNGVKHNGSTGGAGGYNGGGRGGDGRNGYQGGDGGGGVSDIRRNGQRLVIAGGSGGGCQWGRIGGPGGAPTFKRSGTSLTGSGKQGKSTAPGDGGANNVAAGRGTALSGGRGINNPTGHGAGGGGGGSQGGGGGGYLDAGGHPGGGGANYTGGLNQAKPIRSEAGVLVSTGPKLYGPQVSFSYTSEVEDYVWEINPNDGGSPAITKNLTISNSVGPNRVGIVQEGQSSPPVLSFGGVILTQEHYETLETWFDRRIFIKLTDDLGREFYGVFTRFTPRRVRRPSRPWYHTYEAEFTAQAYKNASGDWVYGRL